VKLAISALKILLVAIILAALAMTTAWLCRAAEPSRALRLSGPPVVDSLPLLALSLERQWPGLPGGARFIPWHTPDQLRALVAGGQVDAVLTTTATAANLRNKGLDCTVIQIITSPGWIISTRRDLSSLSQLAGREVLLPFGPGEMPEVLFKVLCDQAGVGVRTRYCAGAMEAVNLMLMDHGRQAMLAEPAASLALARSRQLAAKGALRLYKAINTREAWRRAFGYDLANSGLVMVGPASRRNDLRNGLRRAYVAAYRWVQENPDRIRAATRGQFPALASQIGSGVISLDHIRLVSGPDTSQAAWSFLELLHANSPATVGGRMPDAGLLDLQP
jgi:NitT/TauT family transport system substrate-binding protein